MRKVAVYDIACLLSEVEFLTPLSTKTLLMIAQKVATEKRESLSTELKTILNIHDNEIFAKDVEKLSQQLSAIIG